MIDIATRHHVFRSMPLSRLACFFYSLTSESLTVLALVPPKTNITVPDLLMSEFQDSFGYGGPDVDNTMHDLRALFVCLWLDDRCPPRRKVTTVCLRYLRFSPHLSFLYATDVRRTANMAELAVMTTLDRTAWLWRSLTVCD